MKDLEALFIVLLGGSWGLVNGDSPKEIHLAGIFPINGVEGWQGGQVGIHILLHLRGKIFERLKENRFLQ